MSAAVAAALLLSALAGCTSSTSAGGTAAGSFAGPAHAAASGEKSAPGAAPQADRSVVMTGTLQLVADSPVRAAARITALVDAAGGHIADSTEDPSGRPTAELTVRIPAAVFQSTLDAIEHAGRRVQNVSVQTTDVTSTVTDYGVRIANLRVSIARLQQLLAKAASNADLVQLESSLTDREGSLEQLLAQQRELADQVTYATLNVSIVVPAAAPKAGPVDFLSGLVTGTESLLQTLAALAVGAGVLLPWLVAIGVLGGGATLIVRAIRRRARPTSA